MRVRWGLGLVALAAVATQAAPAIGGTEDDAAETVWRARIQQQFRYLHGISFPRRQAWGPVDRPLWSRDPACDRRIALGAWRLNAEVPKSADGVFGRVRLTVTRLSDPKQDIYAYLRSALDLPGGACREASKAAEAYLRSGPYWIRVLGSCGDGDIFDYEVGEVLNMIAATEEGLPARVLFKPCGQHPVALIASDQFLAHLREPRRFGGKTFPAAREQEKQRLLGAR